MSILKTINFYSRTFLAVTIFGSCAVYGVFCSLFLTMIGKRHLAQWSTARAFYYSFSSIMGIKIKLVGEEKLSKLPGILISNHQSSLDMLVLARVFPPGCTVTAKKSLKYIPFLGWFMSLSGTFFLDRSNREKSVKTLQKSLKQLRDKKRGLYIFPEGTRSYTSELTLLPFKKGAFHLAQQAQIPIIPLIVSNTTTIVDAKTKTFTTGEILIEVLDPIPTEGLKPEDVGALTEKVREQMLGKLAQVGYAKASSCCESGKKGTTPVTSEESNPSSAGDADEEYETVPNEGPGVAENSSLLSKSPITSE